MHDDLLNSSVGLGHIPPVRELPTAYKFTARDCHVAALLEKTVVEVFLSYKHETLCRRGHVPAYREFYDNDMGE